MRSPRVAGNVIRRRTVLVAVIGAVAVAVPLTVFGVTGGGSLLRAASASATGQDYIQYAQGSGSGTYVEYFPGNGSAPTKDTISSGGGGCSTPSLSPPKGGSGVLLTFPAYDYDTNYATRTSTTSNGKAVAAGAYNQKTGVCGGNGQDYTIDNSGGSGSSVAEGLDFTVGNDPSVTGRDFSRAVLNLQQQSSATGTVIVELVETLTGNPGATASQCYAVGPGGPRLVDTNVTDPAASTPGCNTSGHPLLTGFDAIEIRMLTAGGGVSVVGPTSTFYLATKICGSGANGTTFGSTTNNGTTINFSVTLPNGVCKTFTDFEAGQQTINGQPLNVATFDAFSSGAVHYTLTTDWGNQQECSADGSALADGTTTLCPKTQLSLDDQTFTNETYCGGATAADPVCVIKKTYSYSTTNSVTSTDIQETWDALFDLSMRGG
jgi:hypothetical protein